MTSPSTSMPADAATMSRRRGGLRLVVPGLALIALAACSGDDSGTAIAEPTAIAASDTSARRWLRVVPPPKPLSPSNARSSTSAHPRSSPPVTSTARPASGWQIPTSPRRSPSSILPSVYVVYCRTGNRSAQAASEMRAVGLDVYDGGGLDDMVTAGWPVAS